MKLGLACLKRATLCLDTMRLSANPSHSLAPPSLPSYRVATYVTKKEKAAALERASFVTQDRPWDLEVPSMEIILEDATWPLKVRNWSTFWGLFQNWVHAWSTLVLIEREDEEEVTLPVESLAWLQLSLDDKRKIEDVIDTVVASIPALLASGFPVPESVPGKKPWHIGHWKIEHFQDDRGRTQWRNKEVVGALPQWKVPRERDPNADTPGPAPTASVWDTWDAWEWRVFQEKKRAHNRFQADFARRQAEVGRFDCITVSHMTDARLAVDMPFYPVRRHDPTHEEFMATITLDGTRADPEHVGLRIEDPLEPADAFLDGVRDVPDTIDFIRAAGHLTEAGDELGDDGGYAVPSATMEEEFGEGAEYPLQPAGLEEGEPEAFDDAADDDEFGPGEADDLD